MMTCDRCKQPTDRLTTFKAGFATSEIKEICEACFGEYRDFVCKLHIKASDEIDRATRDFIASWGGRPRKAKLWIRTLHFLGLTNLSDAQVYGTVTQ